jgi:hypothetical protein
VNEGITSRASFRLISQLRGVMRVALVVTALALGTTALVQPVTASASTTGPVHGGGSLAARETRLRLQAWRYALEQEGKPYIWGGTGPAGYDCSGLVYAAYRSAGFVLPRTTYEMLDSPYLVQIPKWRARRGDLAFFGTGHVEIYDYGSWTFGAATTGTLIGFHQMNVFWHPTMYFYVRL